MHSRPSAKGSAQKLSHSSCRKREIGEKRKGEEQREAVDIGKYMKKRLEIVAM
jgi:hypothetical protein